MYCYYFDFLCVCVGVVCFPDKEDLGDYTYCELRFPFICQERVCGPDKWLVIESLTLVCSLKELSFLHFLIYLRLRCLLFTLIPNNGIYNL